SDGRPESAGEGERDGLEGYQSRFGGVDPRSPDLPRGPAPPAPPAGHSVPSAPGAKLRGVDRAHRRLAGGGRPRGAPLLPHLSPDARPRHAPRGRAAPRPHELPRAVPGAGATALRPGRQRVRAAISTPRAGGSDDEGPSKPDGRGAG